MSGALPKTSSGEAEPQAVARGHRRRPDPYRPGRTPATAPSWEARIGGVRVLAGPGRLAEIGRLARETGGRHALVVTDPGVAAAGHPDRAERALAEAGLEVSRFEDVSENPGDREIQAGAAFAAERGVDLLVGVGGGSALDAAKGIGFLLANGGRMEDYWGWDEAPNPLPPALGVPTTAGTGSEAQSYALVTHDETHRKMACGSPSALFRAVVLDPELALTAPLEAAAAAGLDAVSHAVESAVSTASNPVSRMLSREAFRHLARSLETYWSALSGAGTSRPEDGSAVAAEPPVPAGPRAAETPSERVLAAAAEALLGAHLAGAAIEQSMLGAAHATANPLTARFGVRHGHAVALMLPHVVRANAGVAADGYAELLLAAGLESLDGERRPAEELASRLERLAGSVRGAGVPRRLGECGVERSSLLDLAEAATAEWTGRHNPRPMTADDFLELYAAAL